jgi:hypothetical protein
MGLVLSLVEFPFRGEDISFSLQPYYLDTPKIGTILGSTAKIPLQPMRIACWVSALSGSALATSFQIVLLLRNGLNIHPSFQR